MRCTPRTCPSIRRSRFRWASLFEWYPGSLLSTILTPSHVPCGGMSLCSYNTPHGYISATANTETSTRRQQRVLADDTRSVGRPGLTRERRQQWAHLLVHLRFLPGAPNRAIALPDLELVAELVCSALWAHARAPQILGEQRGDDLLLVGGKVGSIDRGDHVQTRHTTTAD